MSGINYGIIVGNPGNRIEDITISMHVDRPELIKRIRKTVREYFEEQAQQNGAPAPAKGKRMTIVRLSKSRTRA